MLNIITKGSYRLGNAMLINIGCSILAQKLNLKVSNYPLSNLTDQMDISLFHGGEEKSPCISVTDYTVCDFLATTHIDTGINFEGFFQMKEFIIKYKNEIRSFFPPEPMKVQNTVFCTVRLDDERQHNPGIEYYRKALTLANCTKGFISSDEIDHEMIDTLAKEFNLEKLYMSAAEKIKLSRTCDNIVLTQGSFSWWIGFLNYSGMVYYPTIKSFWHGDIFDCNGWTEVQH